MSSLLITIILNSQSPHRMMTGCTIRDSMRIIGTDQIEGYLELESNNITKLG
jgi:hypothetical protein